jgi:hypothetical protein
MLKKGPRMAYESSYQVAFVAFEGLPLLPLKNVGKRWKTLENIVVVVGLQSSPLLCREEEFLRRNSTDVRPEREMR